MNDLKENKEFKPFVMEDIFELFTGALISNEKIKNGNIPRVTATENNNGIAMFTNEIYDKNFKVYENFISISFLGDTFYQKNKVSLDMKIHGIKPKKKSLNKYIAQFLLPLIRNFSSKYSYGNQLSMRLLKRQKLNLPITQEELPDWDYMESIGIKIYSKKNEYIKKYIIQKHHQLEQDLESDYKHLNLKNKEWRTFEVAEIFTNVQRGKRLTKANQVNGNTPYISSTALNNGVDGFIGNEKDIRKSSYNITIANSGSVGYSFYHAYDYIASDHVHSLGNEIYNKYHYLFLITLLNRLQNKYHFNREINEKRLKNDKLMLPVTNEGQLDLKYMENYMKQLEYNQLERLLNHMNQ